MSGMTALQHHGPAFMKACSFYAGKVELHVKALDYIRPKATISLLLDAGCSHHRPML